jgi:methylated-DNA-[protein]-cysteine S-methyltransferase
MNKKITSFQKRVYKIVKKIPKGKVTSYKAIAMQLNSSPRAVGQALKVNPYAPRVPCHRVIKSNGEIGGYSGNSPKNIKKKIELLREEGYKSKAF